MKGTFLTEKDRQLIDSYLDSGMGSISETDIRCGLNANENYSIDGTKRDDISKLLAARELYARCSKGGDDEV